MQFRTEILKRKNLVGKCLTMTFAENKTGALWKSFMLRRKEIKNTISADLISMQVYDGTFDFNLHAEFQKWATVEVSDFDKVPEGMDTFVLPGGLYAVFLHKGTAGTAPKTFQYIFREWLPDSGYELDNRPHFEVLGEKYKNDDPDSEEEIWIPIRKAVL